MTISRISATSPATWPTIRPDPGLLRDAAHWFWCQVCWSRCRAEESADTALYNHAREALCQVWVAYRQRPDLRTADQMATSGMLAPAPIDLDAVTVPASRRTTLAAILDDEARFYLDLGTQLGRLAAWALVRQADQVEAQG